MKESKALGSLGKAESALEYLEELENNGELDPYNGGFKPKKLLEQRNDKIDQKKRLNNIDTLRKAADFFYKKKSHLSDKTVNLDADKPSEWGAYQRAVENFLSENGIEDVHLKSVRLDHFENIIFKADIKGPTRRFYFRQLRVFWNFLLDRNIVSENLSRR